MRSTRRGHDGVAERRQYLFPRLGQGLQQAAEAGFREGRKAPQGLLRRGAVEDVEDGLAQAVLQAIGGLGKALLGGAGKALEPGRGLIQEVRRRQQAGKAALVAQLVDHLAACRRLVVQAPLRLAQLVEQRYLSLQPVRRRKAGEPVVAGSANDNVLAPRFKIRPPAVSRFSRFNTD